jgi:predicted  nucleic acid-binding Zn-ribbon protein
VSGRIRRRLNLYERPFGERLTAQVRLRSLLHTHAAILDRAFEVEDQIYRLMEKVSALRDERKELLDRLPDCEAIERLAARLLDEAHEPVREWSDAEWEKEAA